MKLSLYFVALLAAFAPTATLAAPTNPLTIHVPVTLANIDREFDFFTVDCQIQWVEPFVGNQFANGDSTTNKLVNRGFNGIVDVYWTPDKAEGVQRTSNAVCSLTFHSSTDPKKNYSPDNQFGSPLPAALPLPGAPRVTTLYKIPIH